MDTTYHNLKIIERMNSKSIIFLYIFYIFFIEFVFINKVSFDIILISTVLTFLLTFSLSSFLSLESKYKDFFKELKNLYKSYQKKYKTMPTDDIKNELTRNTDSILHDTFLSFIVIVGMVIGTYIGFKIGPNIGTFNLTFILILLSVLGILLLSTAIFEKVREDIEEIITEKQGITGILGRFFFTFIVNPLYLITNLIIEGLISLSIYIFAAIIIGFVGSFIFGNPLNYFLELIFLCIDFIIIAFFAIVCAATIYGIFYLFGFGIERFKKKDILYMENGLNMDMEKLKIKYNINDDTFKSFDYIKYIFLFLLPFLVAYIWSFFSTDAGFSILSYLKPINIRMIDIFGAIPNWSIVTNSEDFFTGILNLIFFIISFIFGVILIPFLGIGWLFQSLFILIIGIFNSIIGFLLLASFLFPVLYAANLKFKYNKSLTNFVSIYFYISFILFIFFLCLM